MLPTGGHKVDVVSFDIGVLQYIRQFNDIFTCLRKHRGKQMAQVMREHFAGAPSLFAKRLHLAHPDVGGTDSFYMPRSANQSLSIWP